MILVLYQYGEVLGQLLFKISGIGSMLQVLSFGAVFMYLGQTIVGILQGLGRTRTVFINNFLGSAAKLIGMYYCIRTLAMGSNGIACGMVLGYGLQCLLNLLALARQVQLWLPWKAVLLPVGNSLLMLWMVWLCQRCFGMATLGSLSFSLGCRRLLLPAGVAGDRAAVCAERGGGKIVMM